MWTALRKHWPEYLMEAWGLGTFMISAGLFATLLEYPQSPVHLALPDPGLRNQLMGMAMGLTAFAIFYSPWGRQSGAHINPAATLTFLRLGKIKPADALFYMIAQCVGGLLGVLLVWMVLGRAFASPPVSFVATVPGSYGVAAAFGAEVLIAAGMMTLILVMTSNPNTERFAGIGAALLVGIYIAFESPISGMSINPARTLASAIPSGNWTAWWIYLVAPPLGMLTAASVYLAFRKFHACPKMHHCPRRRCIFCGHEPGITTSP